MSKYATLQASLFITVRIEKEVENLKKSLLKTKIDNFSSLFLKLKFPTIL
jgi:hypothetical protein